VPFNYVALGDSAGQGFGVPAGAGYVPRVHARLQGLRPGARLHNFSRNGATVAGVRADQLGRAVPLRPDLVSLFVGGNDLWRGSEPRAFARELEGIADALDRVRARVVVGTVPNLAHAPAAGLAERFLGVAPAAIEDRVRAYNERLRRLAVDHGYALVDLFAARPLAGRAEYFLADGFHPSAEGHAAWAELMWPAVASLVTPG
jgi:lysophospholipase L1-like esterase